MNVVMKKIILLLISILVAFSACEKPDTNAGPKKEEQEQGPGTGDEPKDNVIVTTSEAQNVCAFGAYLRGYATLSDEKPNDFTIGFLISTTGELTSSSCINIEEKEYNEDLLASTFAYPLIPNTKYYYCCYVCLNGKIVYGNTKEFTTKPLDDFVDTNSPTNVSVFKATIMDNY